MKAINHIHQKYGMSCGQAVVAMIAGVTEKESITVFGHYHGTKTWEVVNALEHYGIKLKTTRLVRIKKNEILPPRAVIHLRWEDDIKIYLHWAVIWDREFYDPNYREKGLCLGTDPWVIENKKGRITSYIKIEETI
jgi:hypothetical protein